jgi:hypothetical protein
MKNVRKPTYDELLIENAQLKYGCHAHCRRNFVDVEKTEPEWAKQLLNLYKKLYKIESEIKEMDVAEKYRRRRCRRKESTSVR